jgi:hypothetical protein
LPPKTNRRRAENDPVDVWSLWQRRYGGDRAVVGRAIRVSGQTTTVIGVMPSDFRLLMPPDSAVPGRPAGVRAAQSPGIGARTSRPAVPARRRTDEARR